MKLYTPKEFPSTAGYQPKASITFFKSDHTIKISLLAIQRMELSKDDKVIFQEDNGRLYLRRNPDGFKLKVEKARDNKIKCYSFRRTGLWQAIKDDFNIDVVGTFKFEFDKDDPFKIIPVNVHKPRGRKSAAQKEAEKHLERITKKLK